MVSADDALKRLIEGNKRFVAGDVGGGQPASAALRASLVEGQEPFAVILGCADSRVPAELVFDQGPGDLFVVRVAGNVVAPSQIGSVEFAAEQFGTRLVVVLGHSSCGAVKATIEQLRTDAQDRSKNLRSIVGRVRPAIEPLLDVSELEGEALLDAAVRANVRLSADKLRHGSQIIEDLIDNDGLRIVGAEYSLETGVVDFFERGD